MTAKKTVILTGEAAKYLEVLERQFPSTTFKPVLTPVHEVPGSAGFVTWEDEFGNSLPKNEEQKQIIRDYLEPILSEKVNIRVEVTDIQLRNGQPTAFLKYYRPKPKLQMKRGKPSLVEPNKRPASKPCHCLNRETWAGRSRARKKK